MIIFKMKNKRGQIELTMETIVKIIFGVVIVILALALFYIFVVPLF